MDEKPPVDLMPHEWKSERPAAQEPLWGAGWPLGAAVLISIVVAAIFSGTWEAKVIGGIIGAVATFIFYQFL